MKDNKAEKIFNYSIGCVGIIGVLVTIIALIVAITQPTQVIAIINQVSGITQTPLIIQVTAIGSGQATPETLPTYTPYPTYTTLPTYVIPSSSTIAPSSQIVETRILIIELVECIRQNENITCHLKITNIDSKDKLIILYSANLFDDLGYEYAANNYVLGNKSGNAATHTSISNVTNSAELLFRDVSPNAQSVSLLVFRLCDEENRLDFDVEIEFRNIPITK